MYIMFPQVCIYLIDTLGGLRCMAGCKFSEFKVAPVETVCYLFVHRRQPLQSISGNDEIPYVHGDSRFNIFPYSKSNGDLHAFTHFLRCLCADLSRPLTILVYDIQLFKSSILQVPPRSIRFFNIFSCIHRPPRDVSV
jgi:hypothetical protein